LLQQAGCILAFLDWPACSFLIRLAKTMLIELQKLKQQRQNSDGEY
jgi:hypothetical protein